MGGDPPVFAAGNVMVRTVLRLEPLFGDELPRWYVPEENIEETKSLQRPFRMQAMDGALAVLRALCHSGAEALLAIGEGVLPLLVILHRAFRFQAYVARRVTGAERDRLEGEFLRVQYVLLLAPCLHPPHVGLRGVVKALGNEVT